MVVKPMESLRRCELCVPRWLSVHGTHKPRLRRLGRNSVAAYRGSEPIDQAAFSESGANCSAAKGSGHLGHLGNRQTASNVQGSGATFPESPTAATVTAATIQVRHTVAFISIAPSVTLNGTRSLTSNARDYLGMDSASGPESEPMDTFPAASVTPFDNHRLVNFRSVSTRLAKRRACSKAASDSQLIRRVLDSIQHSPNRLASKPREEKKGSANRLAEKSHFRDFSQIPSVAVESAVGPHGAF